MAKINFSKVDTSGLLPEGDYTCMVENVEERKSAAGNEVWRITLCVEAGEFAGRKIYDNLVWTEKAFRRIKQICEAIGGICSEQDAEVEILPSQILGGRVVASLIHEVYNGEKREKVAFSGYAPAIPPGEAPHGPELSPDDLPF